MPQFTLIAYDGTDAGAAERRQKARPHHIQALDEVKRNGNALCGAAILDNAGKMIGSVMMMDFTSRAAFDAWLTTEPYVTGKVWDKITVLPCKLGPSFESLRKNKGEAA